MLTDTGIEAIGMMTEDKTLTAVDLLKDEMTEETGRARQNVEDMMTQGNLEMTDEIMTDESEVIQEIGHLTTTVMTETIEEEVSRIEGLITTKKTMEISSGESET